ncbi:MAG: hypothetical protein A2Y42_00410 [Omnitrophica WOR_2 bacterium GWB2_45_9]|nr:MAG: hypothetical protein A2Y42_00410 [Omnitrophica WOR_2 bacterium GWB2_45_9]OGX46141.1 MAG: hypothetical protein A2216_03570 [Omnitrophica WOR_2 bacterium RIFOXYA2_FULL_45_12]HBU08279.1 hypothetical protein [Candidatus Omnitrophota bacterium]
MKTVKHEEIRKEYRREDLGKGIRGKYFEEYKKGTNLVLLSPDVAAAFPDENSVNEALRGLLKVAQQSIGLMKRPSGRRAWRNASGFVR